MNYEFVESIPGLKFKLDENCIIFQTDDFFMRQYLSESLKAIPRYEDAPGEYYLKRDIIHGGFILIAAVIFVGIGVVVGLAI